MQSEEQIKTAVKREFESKKIGKYSQRYKTHKKELLG